jgi:predicted MFS family arabinose efflux permease
LTSEGVVPSVVSLGSVIGGLLLLLGSAYGSLPLVAAIVAFIALIVAPVDDA